jgi:hypothetical protein
MSRGLLAVISVFSSLACSTSRPVGPHASQRLEKLGMPRCTSSPVQPPPAPLRTEITEAERANSRLIAGAFRGQVLRLSRCYENALSSNRNLEVSVKIRWTLNSNGSVTSVCSVDDTKNVPPDFLGCLSSEIATIRFPPQTDQRVDVVYPLIFRLN